MRKSYISNVRRKTAMNEPQIVVVDLGGQYTLLIGRVIRNLGVRPAILSPEAVGTLLQSYHPKGIILSGGWSSICSKDAPHVPDAILAAHIPVLGICLGMHWLAHTLGGTVESLSAQREYGILDFVRLVGDDPLLRNIPEKSFVLASHGDSVTVLPRGVRHTGMTQACPIASFSIPQKNLFGIQFHPECAETEYGAQIFRNFLDICGAQKDWNPGQMIARIRADVLRALPRKSCALLLISGGVDSTTVAALLWPALQERLICVTIDTGGLRDDEMREIRRNTVAAGCAFYVREAKQEFLTKLNGLICGEEKRLAFQEVYNKKTQEIKDEFKIFHVIQGTLAADIIGSGKVGKAVRIHTHHNVGVESIAPLSDLFKDEVRDIARFLGLPDFISERMPFPGPGLYIRIVGVPVTEETLGTVRWADAKVREIISTSGIEKEISQLIVVLTVKTTGIKGDGPVNGYTIVVRAIQSIDFMTGHGYEIPSPIRKVIMNTLTAHDKIARVWFDETSRPPATFELQ